MPNRSIVNQAFSKSACSLGIVIGVTSGWKDTSCHFLHQSIWCVLLPTTCSICSIAFQNGLEIWYKVPQNGFFISNLLSFEGGLDLFLLVRQAAWRYSCLECLRMCLSKHGEVDSLMDIFALNNSNEENFSTILNSYIRNYPKALDLFVKLATEVFRVGSGKLHHARRTSSWLQWNESRILHWRGEPLQSHRNYSRWRLWTVEWCSVFSSGRNERENSIQETTSFASVSNNISWTQ